MQCETLEERIAANSAKPCQKPFRPVFPEAIGPYVAPTVLFLGMTLIGYGVSTGRKWAVSGLVSPNTQMTIMLLLMVADHMSSFWDHSRVSSEEMCLTANISSDTLDDTKGRVIFGSIGVALAATSAYAITSGSITLAATGMPFMCMMLYLCWSPQKFQSCRANGAVTGLLAHGLDVLSLVGILETLFAQSGNTSTSWHTPTIVYSTVISVLMTALIGLYSDYGNRIKPGSCDIDDEEDAAAEKAVDRKAELLTGVAMSVTSVVYFLYLKLNFTEVSCCAAYPALVFLAFDVLTKLQVWKRGESLVGDALHRSFIYITVQVMDILLSSSSMLSFMSERGMRVGGVARPRGLLTHAAHLAGGSVTYVWNILRLVGALITGKGNLVATGSIKRLAEIVKLVSLNVAANVTPLLIDMKNSSYMLNAAPQNDLNVPCHVD